MHTLDSNENEMIHTTLCSKKDKEKETRDSTSKYQTNEQEEREKRAYTARRYKTWCDCKATL